MKSNSDTTKSKIEPLVPLGGRSPWSVLPPLILGFFMIMVDTTIVNVAIPTLVKEFDTTIILIGWVNSAYMLSYASLLLVSGRLGDRFGSRNIFIAGLIFFVAASAICGLSGNVATLIAARGVQGIGAALMTPQTMSMITRVFPPAHRGAAMGLWGATVAVATITGPTLGGILVSSWGWKWIFFVNIPVGIVALWLALTRLPRLKQQVTSIDGLSVILSTLGLFLVIFGIQEGETFNWGYVFGPIHILAVIGLGLIILTLFILRQRQLESNALMPLSLFRNRNFDWANVAGLAGLFTMVALNFSLMMFLQLALGLSPLQAALVSLPSSLISGMAAPVAGRLSDRVPAKWVAATGFALFFVSVTWLSQLIKPEVAVWQIILVLMLSGMGSSCVFSPLANIATSGLDAKTAGAGSGTFNTARQIGGVIGSAVTVAVLTSRLAAEIPAAAARLAGQIPEKYREDFLDQIMNSTFNSSSLSNSTETLSLPENVPASVAQNIESVAQQVFIDGFSVAVGQTMLVTALVALLGLLAVLSMKAKKPEHPSKI